MNNSMYYIKYCENRTEKLLLSVQIIIDVTQVPSIPRRAQKKHLDDSVDTVRSPDNTHLSSLKQLRQELEQCAVTGDWLICYNTLL